MTRGGLAPARAFGVCAAGRRPLGGRSQAAFLPARARAEQCEQNQRTHGAGVHARLRMRLSAADC